MNGRGLYRTMAGFAVAPLVPFLLVGLAFGLWVGWEALWALKLFLLLLSYVTGAFVGVSVHCILRSQRIGDAKHYAGFGAGGSGLVVAAVMAPFVGEISPKELFDLIGSAGGVVLFFAAVGACAGFVFWLIAVRARRLPAAEPLALARR